MSDDNDNDGPSVLPHVDESSLLSDTETGDVSCSTRSWARQVLHIPMLIGLFVLDVGLLLLRLLFCD